MVVKNSCGLSNLRDACLMFLVLLCEAEIYFAAMNARFIETKTLVKKKVVFNFSY